MQLARNGMTHTTSTTMVFQSDDYSKFNMIKGNRTLDMNKIKRILSDIERGTNLLHLCPIIVVEKSKKLDIVDGQHRFMVARKLKHTVFYIVGDSLSLYDIARMNSNTEKWKAKDFINCYKELGNENYVKLEKFMSMYPQIPVTTATGLLALGKVQGGGGTELNSKFQRGEFVVTYEKAAVQFLKIIDGFAFKQNFSRAFMQAIEKVIDSGKFSVEKLTEKVNANIDILQDQSHWRKYLTNMEEIVAKGKHGRVAIY